MSMLRSSHVRSRRRNRFRWPRPCAGTLL